MKNENNIIIIGAGPIGCYLAQLLKNSGLDTLLIEEHKEIGRPIHCAGLVGKKVFYESKIPILKDCIVNTINGAVIHLDDDVLTVRRKEVAYIIDRERFDKELGKNLNIAFETRFLGLEKNKKNYIIETDKGDFFAEIVVGADGANSLVRNIVLGKNNKFLSLCGVQFRMKFKPNYTDMVEVYIKKPYFYWIIPESENVVRVGVISQNPYHELLEFIKEKKLGNEILEKFAGFVPVGYLDSLLKERIFLVGDSACQVKPLTYGGVYLGMRAAEILADCIITGKYLNYQLLWRKKFGKEIIMALKIKEIFNNLSDKDIKRLFLFAKEKVNLIEEKGDFENHSSLLWEFLKNPTISKEVLSIFFNIFKMNF
ncbi:MAG: NAD(P)/FAD-dependent oxidoreductase [Candidatus Omnitrophica bacterium]|nr:NAD(P)/FAD-dependent oxidoreductase [Candidatus Omnitrophota bacterium]